MLERCHMCDFNMKTIHKIPVELPKHPSPKKRRKSLLRDIGGFWYLTKLGQDLPPLNKRRFNKKYQKEGAEINRKLTKANQYWNG